MIIFCCDTPTVIIKTHKSQSYPITSLHPFLPSSTTVNDPLSLSAWPYSHLMLRTDIWGVLTLTDTIIPLLSPRLNSSNVASYSQGWSHSDLSRNYCCAHYEPIRDSPFALDVSCQVLLRNLHNLGLLACSVAAVHSWYVKTHTVCDGSNTSAPLLPNPCPDCSWSTPNHTEMLYKRHSYDLSPRSSEYRFIIHATLQSCRLEFTISR